MKIKCRLILILISFFILAASFNASAQGLGVFPAPDTPKSGSGYYVSLEGLFLEPHIQEPLGVLSDHHDGHNVFNGSESVPENVALENAAWGRDGGARVAFGKNVPNSPWDFGLEFTWITSGDVKELADNDGANSGETLFQAFLPRNLNTDFDQLNVRGETDLQIIYGDFLAKYNTKIGESFALGFSGGLRFAYVENDRLFTAIGHTCSSSNNSGCVLSHRTDYWGVGPRVITQVGWQATDRLSLFANLGFTVLVGEMDRRTDEHGGDSFNDNRSLIQDVRGKVVPVVDSQVGLQYSSGGISFKVGYEFQNWFKLHERTVTNPGAQENDAAYQQVNPVDIGLEGPFASAKLTF